VNPTLKTIIWTVLALGAAAGVVLFVLGKRAPRKVEATISLGSGIIDGRQTVPAPTPQDPDRVIYGEIAN